MEWCVISVHKPWLSWSEDWWLLCDFSNCLFRALGDQLEGHSRNHYRHRQEVVKYMLDHRKDFEPFVEDDVPFDDHSE